jgi:hypothetical protein
MMPSVFASGDGSTLQDQGLFGFSMRDARALTVMAVVAWVFPFGSGNPILWGQSENFLIASSTPSSTATPRVSSWPYELSAGNFQIHSTVPDSKLQRFVPKIASLPAELSLALGISVMDQPVHIVVLESRELLDAYVKRILPSAPSRRALYIRHRGPGLVLTYFNGSWLTDVRHECTHAILDANNVKVPQWLDEGLAEYFESTNLSPLSHATHSNAVQSQIRFGQVADLEQLERMPPNHSMTAKDYRDAWSVVAFLLNSSTHSQMALQTYLQDLQNDRAGGFLAHRLKPAAQSWREDFISFFRKPPPSPLNDVR